MRSTSPVDSVTARREGAAWIIKRQLRCLFGDLSPELEQRLEQAEFPQLEAWAESLLQATRLDEIFNDSGLSRLLEIKSEAGDIQVLARRIGDRRYRTLARNGIGIDPDYAFWMLLTRPHSREEKSLDNLARFYAAFREAYGESGSQYDNHKGAFNFAFEIQVLKEATTIPYALNVVNFRSGVEFRYCKIIAPDETRYDRMIMHRPFAEEFSREQMNMVSAYLCGFAEEYWQTAGPGDREFLKWVDSNLILFGCHAGSYFEEHFRDQEAFEAEKADRQRRLQSSAVPAATG